MKYLVLFLSIAFVQNALADPWEDVTYDEAFKVQKLLKKYPFVLDYCDCCDGSKVFLLKIMETEMITCPYNGSKYSIKTKAVRIGKFDHWDGRVDVSESVPFDYEEERLIEYTVSMNYTFAYKKKTNTCAPLGRIIDYSTENTTSCDGVGVFPNPFKNNIEIHDDDYKKWARKRLKFK